MKRTAVFDIELYRNYFLIAFRNVETGRVVSFEMTEAKALDIISDLPRLRGILSEVRLVSFNGINYDIPILSAALHGFTCAKLKEISDDIIQNNMRPWIVAKHHGFKLLEKVDHIDLIEVAPGRASLKIYGGRIHSRRMRDLPYEHNALLTDDQRAVVKDYCINDLELTYDLWRELSPQIELREKMSERYMIDLRSKSDAQIAEAVIKDGVGTLLERNIKPPLVRGGTEFHYRVPNFISFKTDTGKRLLDEVAQTPFVVADSGKVVLPENLKEHAICIGDSAYRLGIGGLHSSEESVAHYSDDEFQLVDRDVASYYPMIILNQRLFPKQMGEAFLKVYKSIVDERLAAKKTGDKVTDAALKITINGSFGKFGSKYSALYSPELLIQTTITGQLALLMLIETLEMEGTSVVSANTDGIVLKVRRSKQKLADAAVLAWELRTGFSTEAKEYDALYSRDVNNYIAVLKGNKGHKSKGVYAPAGLMKNPNNQICVEAVVEALRHGTPIAQTIRSCRDVRKFVTIRQVQGGAVKHDEYLGKAIRWYYSTSTRGTSINYKVNGYLVPRSEGAKPLMLLPPELPADIDYEWYINEAYTMLVDIGAV